MSDSGIRDFHGMYRTPDGKCQNYKPQYDAGHGKISWRLHTARRGIAGICVDKSSGGRRA